MMSNSRVAVVIPVYNEGEAIIPCIDRMLEAVTMPCEILVVYDDPDDPTVDVVRSLGERNPNILPMLNTYGPGPANAIRFGIDAASAPVAVVTMADGSDDPQQIEDLVRLVERGVVIAAGSRYMPGGQQVDAPRFKAFLSRGAGVLLHALARVGTRDATNSFKAYDVAFVRQVGIHSKAGFEIGIELVAKARRLRLPVAEIPTIWIERQVGLSSFRLLEWIPRYLDWFLFAFGSRLAPDELIPLAESRRAARDDDVGDWRGRLHRGLRRGGAVAPRARGHRSRQSVEVRTGPPDVRR